MFEVIFSVCIVCLIIGFFMLKEYAYNKLLG